MTLDQEVLNFLSELESNNNREWFEQHKPTFLQQQEKVKKFLEQVLLLLREHDDIEEMKMFRIYRDVRFSHDKTPYKSHFAAEFKRRKPALRGGYYLMIKPGESLLGLGFWNPNREDLYRIRKELEMDASKFRSLMTGPEFKRIWGQLEGESLSSAPKDFDKNHPDIDLIRWKQFIFSHNFTNEEVLSHEFAFKVNDCFKAARPWLDYMSEVLGTNLNGESIL